MRPKTLFFLTAISVIVLLFTGCSPSTVAPTQAVVNPVTPTVLVDQCAPETITTEVAKLDELITEFEDVLGLAGVTPQQQLAPVILRMQDVRRNIEKLELPACADVLRASAVTYVNQVVSYLTIFMGGTVNADELNKEIAASDSLKVAFETERARLLGIAYVPEPTRTPQPTAVVVVVTNPTDADVPIYEFPRTNSNVLGSIQPGGQAMAVARTADNTWLLIAVSQEQFACVEASKVSVQGSIDLLETFQEVQVTPTP